MAAQSLSPQRSANILPGLTVAPKRTAANPHADLASDSVRVDADSQDVTGRFCPLVLKRSRVPILENSCPRKHRENTIRFRCFTLDDPDEPRHDLT